jgi:trimeric autotransporter adhesin
MRMNANALRAASLTACACVLLLLGCSDSAGPPVAASISVSQTNVSLTAIGETIQLTAAVKDQGGASMQGAAVSWRSSNDAVATVSSSGVVTAVANGTATITASSGTATGSAAVSVEQRPASVRLTPGTVTLPALRDTVTLRADVLDARGNAVAGGTVQWSTSNAAVATVSPAGLVTAMGNGSAAITATAGSVNGAAQVSVQQTPHALRVSPGTITIAALTDTVRLTATVLDARDQPIAAAPVTWSSSNAAVATVSGGVVTAVSNGTTTITATSGSQYSRRPRPSRSHATMCHSRASATPCA